MQPAGHVVHLLWFTSAKVPFGQLLADTQEPPERKFVWQERQNDVFVQFPQGGRQF